VLTENDVVNAVGEHLTRTGYRVERQLSTSEHGIDIEAVHIATKRRLLIEAKGGTSSKETTNRFGKPFNQNQAKCHIAVAFYCAAKLRQDYASEGAAVAIALPDDKLHRIIIEKISGALRQLKIGVCFVSEDRIVNEL
jgi:hypothetical protein